ncbi:hypothetical protein BsWGS_09069 [Bradybaena similaris]
MAATKQWRKILYEKQDYADNYVDASFLNELRKNLFVRAYDYQTLIVESTCITQQLTSIALFITMFFCMEDHSVSPQAFWVLASLLTICGYTSNMMMLKYQGSKITKELFFGHLKTCLLFQGFSAALSPLLVSLTETISTDTIYAMTTIMLLANLLFYHYQSSEESVPGALSLNAAVFASVCLASRLHTPWHAFTTVTTSFELFALWPLFRRNLKAWNQTTHVIFTVMLTCVCVVCLGTKTFVGAVLYTLVVLFVTCICPIWLYRLQPHKNNIYGPWDEATPT